MFKRPITLEHALYVLALLIAIGMRFLHLADLPLADQEASYALQALGIANGQREALLPNTAYIHLTTILFYLFAATDFTARFFPALVGASLVLAPWFLRDRMGRVPALVLAFGLALDPGLNAISRMAGGSSLAITFVIFSLVLWLAGHRKAVGVFAGLSVLSGPAFWFGGLSLLFAWGLEKLLLPKQPPTVSAPKEAQANRKKGLPPEVRNPLLWGVGTILLLGSLLMISPLGVVAVARSFLDFLSSWWTLSGIPLGRTFLALPAYELLPLGFAMIAVGRGFIKRDRDSMRLSLWALASLLLVLACAGRQVMHLAWAILPLWVLAAGQIGRNLFLKGSNRWVVAAAISFIIILLVLAWLTLAKLTLYDPASTEARLQWIFTGGILLVIAVSLVLVASGWTAAEARQGGTWGFLITLGLFTLAMATGAAGFREPRTVELWTPEPRLGRADLLLKVANDISSLNTGFKESLPVTITLENSPALRWLFHDWKVQVNDLLAPDVTPEILITPLTSDMTLTAEYRGEPLVWREMSTWQEATFGGWLNWFIYRQMPMQREDIILWVRADLMLDDPALMP